LFKILNCSLIQILNISGAREGFHLKFTNLG
jgi:hypothetical protein